MITNLQINNHFLIKKLDISFCPNFNIITGETGTGKTLLLSALNFLRGYPIQRKVINPTSNKIVIQCVLDISDYKKDTFSEYIDDDNSNTIIIRRILDKNGKSKNYINDYIVQVRTLKEIMSNIIDIHGQFENQLFFNEINQNLLFDEKCGLQEIINKFQSLYNEFVSLQNKINELQKSKTTQEEQRDILKYKINEIENSKLTIEDINIESDYIKITNLESLKTDISEILECISNDSHHHDLKDYIEIISNKIDTIEIQDKKLDNIKNNIIQVKSIIDDIDFELNTYFSSLDLDENAYNLIQDKYDNFNRFQMKYNISNVTELFKLKEKFENELNEISSLDNTIDETVKKQKDTFEKLLKLGKKISDIRKKNIIPFENKIKSILTELGFQYIDFNVNIINDFSNGYKYEKTMFWKRGLEKIEFLISTVPEKSVGSIKNIASGGEISRITLALKSISNSDTDKIIIFDEIDSGIGGKTAFKVGKYMKMLSKNNQIICVTHLPQIAVYSDAHFKVEKEIKQKTSNVEITQLKSKKDITNELARMVSGKKVTEKSIKLVEELQNTGFK